MRRAARTDANHAEIVKELRKIPGVTVRSLASYGNGLSDLLVGAWGVNFLIEVKDGSKPPSERKLTPEQQVFHDTWAGHVAVAESLDDALRIIGL